MDEGVDRTVNDASFVRPDKPLSDLRVMVLQRELARRGLPAGGRKHELVDRLQSALDKEDSAARADSGGFVWDIFLASEQVNAPKARAGHGLVSFCNRLYLFGGFSITDGDYDRYNEPFPYHDQLNRPTVNGLHFNSVHEYSFDTKTWKELHPGSAEQHIGSVPKARRHASLVVHGCALYVYGGFDANDEVLSDMWEFDLQRQSWLPVQYRVSHSNERPIGRAEHTAIVFLNRMIIFGGYDGKRKLNDTYVFDFATKKWSCPALALHNAPSRRCKHTAVLYNTSMYVLGGFQYNNGENYALTDMHELDLQSFVWNGVLMNPGCPQALQGHKAIVMNDKMYVVGGKVRATSTGYGGEQRTTGLNQSVFSYSFDAFCWSVLDVDGHPPNPRQLHAAVTVQKRGGQSSIYVFGGTDKAKQKYFDDLCELRPKEAVIDNPCTSCSSTRRLLNNPKFSDVQFIVDGQIVYSHRAILYSRSEYFRTMFESQMRESSAREIPIPGVSHNVFLTVMEYLYTDRTNVTNGQQAVEVLKAADMFHLDGLRALCVTKVEQAITVENVAAVCDIADTHNTESLKELCMGFINQNFKSVISTEAFQNLMRDDPGGLGKEILECYADSYPYGPYSAATHKRPRK